MKKDAIKVEVSSNADTTFCGSTVLPKRVIVTIRVKKPHRWEKNKWVASQKPIKIYGPMEKISEILSLADEISDKILKNSYSGPTQVHIHAHTHAQKSTQN